MPTAIGVGEAMPQRMAAGLVIVGLVLLVAATLASPLTSVTGVRGWYAEATDGDADTGWDRLSERVRSEYPGGRAQYDRAVLDADWTALVLGPFDDAWEDDGFVHVRAVLRSAPESLPLFLLDRGLVHALCDERGRPTGIGVYESRRPFEIGQFSAGGLTGSQRRCQAAFRAAGP